MQLENLKIGKINFEDGKIGKISFEEEKTQNATKQIHIWNDVEREIRKLKIMLWMCHCPPFRLKCQSHENNFFLIKTQNVSHFFIVWCDADLEGKRTYSYFKSAKRADMYIFQRVFGTFAPGLNISGHVSMDLSIGGDEKEKCVLTQTGDVSI